MNDQLSHPHAETLHRHTGGFHIRRTLAADAGSAMPSVVSSLPILHIEPIQSVQNRHNTVSLSAGKQTLVRVYLDTSALPDGVQLRGELGIRTASGGGEVFVPGMDSITTGPSQNVEVQYRRHDLSGSLNFLLPVSVASGKKVLRVSRLEGPDGVPLKVEDLAFNLAFVRCAPLRVRAVGLQYRDQGKLYAPTADDFASLRSFLKRAYPSAEVEWSHLVVDADFEPPFNQLTPVRANAQLAAIRSRDVSSGIDPRTHYYGLVSDAQGQHFMRGQANAIPGTPSPHAVACGPAGLEQLPNGPSPYTGWYGAHELGHTFGRYHPGFPPLYFPDGQRNPRGQDDSDDTFPYADGSLTLGDDEFVVFDAGDPAVRNAEMRIMRGSECFDVMTYLDNLWVSAYTLEAIRLRLNDENKLGA